MSPDDAPREHFSNLADPPWSIVASGQVLGTGNTGTDAWRAVLAAAEAERDALRVRAEAAEAKAKQAADDHDFLARQIGAAAIASTLAPGESLVHKPGETPFFLIGVVERLVARAHAAEATAARLNAANVRLMRRLAPAMGAWKAAADELAKMGRRAVEAEAAVAAAAAAGPITVCDCGVGGPRLCDEDGLCVNCGCDVVVVADQHSADIVAQLRQEREAAEALATARAEVDAAFQQGLTAGQVATCGALSAIAAEVASAGFDETATAIRIAAATLIKADLRLERGPVESA
jgi:hypothetical protein